MRLGLVLPMFSSDANRVLRFAERAERLGFDGVFAFDHLMPLGGPADGPALECFASLAAVAATTERVSLGTLVARASLRAPGLLAKQAASVHAMSGGRLILTVGTGDRLSKREHDAFGLPYLGPGDRRRHLEQTVAAVVDLFTGREWRGGDDIPPIRGPLLPSVSADRPAVWIGGTSEAAVTSAATLADGWNGWGLPLDVFASRAERLRVEERRLADERAPGLADRVAATWGGVVLVGRDRPEVDALLERRAAADKVPPPNSWIVDAVGLVENLLRLRDAGASWAILLPSGPEDRVDLIAEVALPALTAA
jgi:alkanesulfonate monooxygenase SsuD/methylene tetrahydromethanopterin reductase-like flavin-dependent oxidoreductase (luciferase family)